MDSPVILDKASEFGEPIDLDRPFRGFPFDDDGFGRRSDIRSHLDDLAARRPEFADLFNDIPFHGSFRNRNRGPGNGGNNNNSSYQGYSDEDARSQASGSSAASGASGVSSHGEPEANQNQQDNRSRNFEQSSRRSQIPQYGLRNTVDIGQHHHNMENPDKGNRGKRSMSAPPENKQSSNQQQSQQQQQEPQQSPGQRYISRIDITPQHNQPQQSQKPQQQQQPQPPSQQQSKPQQQQSNIRHIPIFVEGRDEPLLPRSFDEPHFRREPSPTQFNAPPYFQRQSPFGQSPFGMSHQWSPDFQDPFYSQQTAYEQPTRRQQQQAHFQQPKQQQYAERQPQQQHYEQPRQQQRQPQQPQQQQQPQQPQQQQEPPKPKPCVPKDPLERVALVQKEVDSLAEQVKLYTGNSRKDKQYIYLDEMLTRELIKLDDIETEGRDNVRQARKNAIRTIQETIGLLESKAPLPSQQTTPEEPEKQVSDDVQESKQNESMDVDQKSEEQSQTNDPIPLPAGPSSPSKMSEDNDTSDEKIKSPDNDQANEQQKISEPMDIVAPVEKSEATPMDVQQNPEQVNTLEKTEVSEENKGSVPEEKTENVAEEKKPEDDSDRKKDTVPEETKPEAVSDETNKAENVSKEKVDKKQKEKTEKMEVDEVKQSPKATKKGKKSKKQVPVSDKPIPLPAPEGAEANAK
ncbi:BAG domain-containing protein starvin isoform X2 [Colletes latitarsis]|uniref:BAG domain-containing protein starvin isoform X2 n=1 Tax=Colletes latitarsis TaxID=2605962 RepID=UPI004035C98D